MTRRDAALQASPIRERASMESATFPRRTVRSYQLWLDASLPGLEVKIIG